MIAYGVIVGLMSFLTPLLFPYLFVVGILYQFFAVNRKLYWLNSVVAVLTISFIYWMLNIIGLNDHILNTVLKFSTLFNYWFILLFLFVSIFLIGFFELNRVLKISFGVIVSVTLSIKIALLSISSSAPVLGSFLASGSGDLNEMNAFFIGESLSVLLVFILIILVSRIIATNFKDKPWSENVPKLLGIYLFSVQIISIYNLFNV